MHFLTRIVPLILLVDVSGCNFSAKTSEDYISSKQNSASQIQLNIVATTNIVADLVKNLSKGVATVDSLMGPGIDPHMYRASQGDVRKLQSADIIVYGGLHLEGKMVDILQQLNRQPDKMAFAVAELVPKSKLISIAESNSQFDPHIWMDVGLWQYAADRLASKLISAYPHQATEFELNRKAYSSALSGLSEFVHRRAEELAQEQKIMVTAHDAFSYFGRAYGFEVTGLLGVSTASEAGAADVDMLVDFIVARHIPAIFVETSVSDRYLKALQQAVRAKGSEVQIGGNLYSDALGSPDTPAADYIGMIRHNVNTIVDALNVSAKQDREP